MEAVPKVKHFWWKACHNILASREDLYKRKCATSLECKICLLAPESIEHLLFECEWTKRAWYGMEMVFNVEQAGFTSIAQQTSQILEVVKETQRSYEVLGKMATVDWFMWKTTNQKIFNDVIPNAFATILRAEGMWNELLLMDDKCCTRKQNKPMEKEETMQQPSPELFICCDGVFKPKTDKAPCVVLLYNSKGGLMDGVSKSFLANSSLVAEAEAIRQACLIVEANSLKNATIASDCLNAIKLSATEDVPQ